MKKDFVAHKIIDKVYDYRGYKITKRADGWYCGLMREKTMRQLKARIDDMIATVYRS